MVEIPLGKLNLAAKVSDEDADLAKIAWYAHKGKGNYHYAAHREGTGARQRLWLHSVVLERMLGRRLSRGELADHINGDKLDNRRTNLRLATRSQNEANKVKGRRGASKYKGVTRARGRWKATIMVNGKNKHLGVFDNEVDAALAYNEAALDNYGEYAKLNVIERVTIFDPAQYEERAL